MEPNSGTDNAEDGLPAGTHLESRSSIPLPEFDLTVPILGNRWAVGIAFQTHLVFVAFIMGIALLGPSAEWLGLRGGGEHWEWLAQGLANTVIRLFAFGATWAVFALVFIFGLYPRLFGVLTGIFFWPLVTVAAIWFVMSVSAYAYAETWDRMRSRRRMHMAIGWVFAGATFVFISLITFLSSYQLTPGNASEWWMAALNASWPTEIIHRHIGNLSYGALILSSYAGVRLLIPGRGGSVNVSRYDWMADTMLVLGLALTLLQPIAGWLYARQIQIGSPGAYERIMTGPDAWLWLVQGFFFGGALFLANLYFLLALRRGRPDRRAQSWIRTSVIAVGILALLLIVPKEWPLGQMMPWKYISLTGMVSFSAVSVAFYWRCRPSFAWGAGGRWTRYSLALTGIALVALLVTMGVIRTSARGEYVIYGRMTENQAQQIEGP